MKTFPLTRDLTLGWNLGNTLDAVPTAPMMLPTDSETLWRNPVTTKSMIDAVKAAGFDVLRVPTTWDKHFTDTPDYAIDPRWLLRVREVVSYGLDNGMRVILNMHHEGWHFPSAENKQAALDKITALWTQIANEFNDVGDELIFEGLNEPRMKGTPLEWQGGTEEARAIIADYCLAFVAAVRATGGNNKTRRLMVTGSGASTDEKVLASIRLPENDKNIIVSVHAYLPYPFALEPGGTDRFSADNPEDVKPIDEMFDRIDRYFLQKGVPVVLGEFGSQNRGGNTAARVDCARYTVRKAREYGVPCVWWDNGYVVTGDELFGLLDRAACAWVFPEIVQAMVEERG